MKHFFSEYGFVALAAIAIIVVIGIASPVGAKIKENVLNLATKEGNTVSTLADTGLKSKAELLSLTIGKVITIEGHKYRVLSLNGTEAELMLLE